jgi:hypothetical protein
MDPGQWRHVDENKPAAGDGRVSRKVMNQERVLSIWVLLLLILLALGAA